MDRAFGENLTKYQKLCRNSTKMLWNGSQTPGNRFGQLVGTHYSIWVHNPNDFLTISDDFAVLKLDQFGVACGSLPIVSRHPGRIVHQDLFKTTSISSDSNASSIFNRFHPIVFLCSF